MNGPTEREQRDPMLSAAMARAAALDDKAAGQYARVNPDWLVALIDHAARVAVLEARVADYENSITWDTTCLNCASLLDANYEMFVRAERAEQQIAAIETLIDEAVDEARRQASTQGPVDPGMLLEYLAQISDVLAAGVVDNPTGDEANADPFTLDDLGHPTEPGCPRCTHPRLAHWTPGKSSTACGVCIDGQIRTADLRTGAVGFCCIPAADIARPTEGSPS